MLIVKMVYTIFLGQNYGQKEEFLRNRLDES